MKKLEFIIAEADSTDGGRAVAIVMADGWPLSDGLDLHGITKTT